MGLMDEGSDGSDGWMDDGSYGWDQMDGIDGRWMKRKDDLLDKFCIGGW